MFYFRKKKTAKSTITKTSASTLKTIGKKKPKRKVVRGSRRSLRLAIDDDTKEEEVSTDTEEMEVSESIQSSNY